MSQLFPRSANTIARLAPPVALLGLGAVAWAWHAALFSAYTLDVAEPVAQPVPFSHEHHVGGLGIDCRYCHTSVETSSFAGIPPTETCMTCHSQVWRDAPMLAPVRESWLTGRPLRWKRVNDLPDYVYFDHSIHVKKGVACVTCHGRVDRMPLMQKAHSLSMRWCLDCHRAPSSQTGPEDLVFTMSDGATHGASTSHLQLHGETRGERLPLLERAFLPAREKASAPPRLEDCSTCHR